MPSGTQIVLLLVVVLDNRAFRSDREFGSD
jgi:hypothetical protein